MALGYAFERQTTTTSGVLREVERWLAASDLDLVFIDRMDSEVAPTASQHRGVVVDLPAVERTDDLRGRTADMDAETLTMQLVYRVAPKDQKESKYAAYDLADKIRLRLTDWHAWRADWNITFQSGQRARHPASAEWFLIEHIYTLRRLAALGG